MIIYSENFVDGGRLIASCIYLKCASEGEFTKTYNKIKHIKGTKQSGCPVEEEGHYEDMIAYVPRNDRSKAEVEEEANQQIERYREVLSKG